LVGDMPLGHDQDRGDQAFHDGWARSGDPAPAQFVHQRRGDRGGVRCGERDWQQPRQQIAAVAWAEHPEAELLAQGVELLAPGLSPRGVRGQGAGLDTQLLGHEAQGLLRECLAGPQ
jgi:hypothetical protein